MRINQRVAPAVTGEDRQAPPGRLPDPLLVGPHVRGVPPNIPGSDLPLGRIGRWERRIPHAAEHYQRPPLRRDAMLRFFGGPSDVGVGAFLGFDVFLSGGGVGWSVVGGLRRSCPWA